MKKSDGKRKYTACKKVPNWGLGPHEDQIAEMDLIWSSFYTKGLIFNILSMKQQKIDKKKQKKKSISLSMRYLGNEIIWQSYHNEY